MNANQIIKVPVLTEKTYSQMEFGYYTFKVDKRSNKIEIAKAVEEIWQVKVEKVNVINVDKRPKKIGKFSGFTPGYKKAIVKLSEGRINFFPDDESAKDDSKLKAIENYSGATKEKSEKSKQTEAKIAAKLAAKKVAKEESPKSEVKSTKEIEVVKAKEPSTKSAKVATSTKSSAKKTTKVVAKKAKDKE